MSAGRTGKVAIAICGAVLGPVAAFGFMRRVPLGQMVVETATGTMAGWGAAYER